jgi:2-methylfumaryl-CoA hydratase
MRVFADNNQPHSRPDLGEENTGTGILRRLPSAGCLPILIRTRICASSAALAAESTAPETVVPELPDAVGISELVVPDNLHVDGYDTALAGSPYLWEDYRVGERIDHIDGMTIEEAEHMMATRLYQNTERVHFNQHLEKDGRFGRRIIYGGHIISLARSLSFNGLANALSVAAINGGRHTNPTFAGDTVYAWSEILNKMALPERADIGALRLRTVATKNRSCQDFPYQDAEGKYDSSVVLDFDYTVLMPRRA